MRIWLARTMEWCDRTSKTDNIHQMFCGPKPCSPCIYALDIEFCQTKSIFTIISMFDTKSGPRPPKIWKRVPAWYARYPSAVWFTILHNSWDDVPNNQIVNSIIVSNVRYRDAEEQANPGSWQSGLRSDRCGCKTWFQSVQNHARHRSQVLVRQALKNQRPMYPKFSDVLLVERPSICALQWAQDAIWNMLFGS